jgi:short-subunit dehydrogenase
LFTQSVVASAEGVARFGYTAMMRGQRVAIPGMANKLIPQGGRILPRRLISFLARKVQENR